MSALSGEILPRQIGENAISLAVKKAVHGSKARGHFLTEFPSGNRSSAISHFVAAGAASTETTYVSERSSIRRAHRQETGAKHALQLGPGEGWHAGARMKERLAVDKDRIGPVRDHIPGMEIDSAQEVAKIEQRAGSKEMGRNFSAATATLPSPAR